jgi:hypothetical protein
MATHAQPRPEKDYHELNITMPLTTSIQKTRNTNLVKIQCPLNSTKFIGKSMTIYNTNSINIDPPKKYFLFYNFNILNIEYMFG